MTDIDFTTYVENKKIFYEKLSGFSILPDNISPGVKLDKLFFERMNNEFADFFERRKTNIRINKLESSAYKSHFNSLDEKIIEIYNYKGPAIYWFKIKLEGNSSNDKIINRFSSIRNQKSGWWSKAKKVAGKQTEYLYVGKVERKLHDRFTQHMGLGHKMTSSLKLAQWFSTLENVELSFHFLKVDYEYFNYLEDIENVIWRKFNPLLGAEPRIKE
ncbi:hypothetical protein DMB65_11765 [Flavobacterium cheongpyeongense]|uniref:Uncharacterized protein n=1 Tax=Flavobacterium cheongpyeongense TaxID=2212651 RepID=A0A2V4BPV7_9FLAO|nr:hypothetical protein [Flavobacterium cheongpyeongense]PXY40582.1 hypothetical protein DMB65_11765 [Flavobacterium cheongpyeongense]